MPSAATCSRALALLLAGLILGSPGRAASPSLKGWRDGPASILLTDDEYRRFGGLTTEEERTAFVERFWRNIEVQPGTSPRAFREAFEARSATANARFESNGKEGWRTDRGRVYLALGEPSTITRESGGIDVLDAEVWTYDAVGAPSRSLKIAFHHCRDGSYRLDPACDGRGDATSVSVDWERAEYLRTLRLNNPSVSGGRLLIMADSLLTPLPGGLPTPAAPETGARGRPQRDDPAAAAPELAEGSQSLEHSAYFFRAQDGTVLTLLAVAMPDSAGAGAAVSLEETGRHGEPLPGGAVRTLTLDPSPAAEASPGMYFGRAYLDAGRTYTARFAVKNPAHDEVVVRNARIGVPDLNAGFSVSSLVPAERFGPAGPDAGPFRIGSEEVVPRPGAVFRRSELLRLYLQVYGAAIDPATSMPRVDVEYRFFRVARKGAAKRYGKPFSVRGAAGAAMGLALPIGDWPTGSYRVLVDLRDRVSGERITVERTFTIAEG